MGTWLVPLVNLAKRVGQVVRWIVTTVRASETVYRVVTVVRDEHVRSAARRAWPPVRSLLVAIRRAWRSARVGYANGGRVYAMA